MLADCSAGMHWERPFAVGLSALVIMGILATRGFAEVQYLDVNVSTKAVPGGESIEVKLAGQKEPLVEPVGLPLFTESKCKADYELKEVPGGFDVVLRLHNPTDEPQERPAFRLHGIRMGTKFSYLDGRSLGHIHERDIAQQVLQEDLSYRRPLLHWRMTYPDDLYSPVALVFNERFAVGLSLIYDPFKEKHMVNVEYHTDGGEHLGRVTMGVGLHQPYPDWQEPKGRVLIEPGATQRYRFVVRFCKAARWFDALEPYREFFRNRYGRVRYTADLRPVFGEPTGLTKFLDEESNPRGYSPQGRLDLEGWKPYVRHVRETALSSGYRRIMIWCPSGLYLKGSNYPCEFMTEWPQKLVETLPVLLDLKRQGVSIGMWWGRSSQVSGGWNSGKMWERDVTNSRDVEAAWAELRLAMERGTDEVGLDAFKYVPLWQRYDWMQKMQEQFPTLRFITESADCDIMHTIAPTFMTWQRQHYEPVLADFLNPGHESWIMLRWQEVNQASFDQLVKWKLVPVTMSRGIEHNASEFVKRD